MTSMRILVKSGRLEDVGGVGGAVELRVGVKRLDKGQPAAEREKVGV